MKLSTHLKTFIGAVIPSSIARLCGDSTAILCPYIIIHDEVKSPNFHTNELKFTNKYKVPSLPRTKITPFLS